MSQDFFATKIRTLFARFDVDLNGKIEEDDFDKWSENLIGLGNLDEQRAEDLRLSLKAVWYAYFLPADTDNDGSVMEAELINHMRDSLNNESKRKVISSTLPLIFEAIDCNQDDGVSSVEFGNYFKSFGLNDDKFVCDVFSSMDANNDGSLNKEGFYFILFFPLY